MSVSKAFSTVCSAGQAARQALQGLSGVLDALAETARSESSVVAGLLDGLPTVSASDPEGSPVAAAYAQVQLTLASVRTEMEGQQAALLELANHANAEARTMAGLAEVLPVCCVPLPAAQPQEATQPEASQEPASVILPVPEPVEQPTTEETVSVAALPPEESSEPAPLTPAPEETEEPEEQDDQEEGEEPVDETAEVEASQEEPQEPVLTIAKARRLNRDALVELAQRHGLDPSGCTRAQLLTMLGY